MYIKETFVESVRKIIIKIFEILFSFQINVYINTKNEIIRNISFNLKCIKVKMREN